MRSETPRMLVIINLVENGSNIIKIINGVLCSIRPQLMPWAKVSKLEHYLIVVDAAVRKTLPKVDDEKVGDESSDNVILRFHPNSTG